MVLFGSIIYLVQYSAWIWFIGFNIPLHLGNFYTNCIIFRNVKIFKKIKIKIKLQEFFFVKEDIKILGIFYFSQIDGCYNVTFDSQSLVIE
jgi:hypothetical protein